MDPKIVNSLAKEVRTLRRAHRDLREQIEALAERLAEEAKRPEVKKPKRNDPLAFLDGEDDAEE
mgnify:CR=1 FL=1